MRQRHVKKLLKKGLCPSCRRRYSIRLIWRSCEYLRCGRNYSIDEIEYMRAKAYGEPDV